MMNKINQQRCQCWLTRFSGLIARYALLMLLLPVTGTAAERQLGSSDLRMLDMESGRQLQTILRSTEVDINISGMISRVVVRQTFANHSARWAEGEYVFPLPDNAAVDHLRMWIGDRFIEGDIMEKQKAERTYQQAREAGKRASLLRQERTNIFTSRVANIPPSSEIIIEIEYQQQVRYQRGEFSVRFPMVVAPRYIPGEVVDAELGGFSGNGWARNTDQVSDASRITPPVAMPASGPLNPVSMLINLHPGFEPAWVESAYHPVVIQENGTNGRVIELQAEAVPADRDFELRWAAHPGETPHAAYFSEDTGEAHHSMLMLVPPTLLGGTLPPRELILVVDTSGSMHGGSIDQARRALRLAIENLEPSDRFNIIQFNDRPSKLYRFPIDADQVNREDALDYIDELEADGGTEMFAALEQALAGDVEPGYLRQIVFLTDGAVGNEARLFELISDELGDSRLFTVGIGSAPNGYFMSRAAEFGRGTYTYIGDISEVQERMADLFAQLRSPALVDVDVQWHGVEVEQYPRYVPDLYLGEPLVVTTQSQHPPSAVTVSGLLGGNHWSRTLSLKQGSEAEGIGVLWARENIKDLMAERSLGGDHELIRTQIIEVALRHHLVSQFTSLVAVDKTPTRPVDESLESESVRTNLPKGWSRSKVFGQLPQTATPAALYLLLGMLSLIGGALLRKARIL